MPGTPPADPGPPGRIRYRIRGGSMYPALAEGEVVEVDTHAFRRRDPRPGDIVLARHPFRARTTLVKRVHAVTGDRYDLRGDDPIESEDSRGFGPLPRDAILGLVVKPR